MSFKLRPFAEVLKLTDEQVDAELAPIRARHAQSKANMEIASLQETMIGLERKINEQCTEQVLNFDNIVRDINSYELAERKAKQLSRIVDQLFPPEPNVSLNGDDD